MHTLTLAAAMLILLPFAIALLVGWTPSRLGTREVSRSYAYAILCLYLAVQHEGPASWCRHQKGFVLMSLFVQPGQEAGAFDSRW
ncbi:hypothetical protein OG264_32975 [Streptomyces xanthophaeus]|uniref:hypothetical protein n=1 Tax=Streptomyces xanthophaeus TaxID=67385 RepID=UPI00386B7757|nr:hypothetical protein OG264_32975 [Streptomyces xanthophaeus]WST59128.1 hypothetical protein OG605_05465 [Streptomyces xanthophaeus]